MNILNLPYTQETNYYPYQTPFSNYQNTSTPNATKETVFVCPSSNPIAVGTLAEHTCGKDFVQDQSRSLACMAAPTGVKLDTISRWTPYVAKAGPCDGITSNSKC